MSAVSEVISRRDCFITYFCLFWPYSLPSHSSLCFMGHSCRNCNIDIGTGARLPIESHSATFLRVLLKVFGQYRGILALLGSAPLKKANSLSLPAISYQSTVISLPWSFLPTSFSVLGFCLVWGCPGLFLAVTTSVSSNVQLSIISGKCIPFSQPLLLAL